MDALILAGGENRRFMSHKALAEIGGRRIIETAVEIFKKYFNKIYISTNNPELFFYLGCPLIGDVIKERGPMTGIYSSLLSTGASELFVIACDMPFINSDLIDLIVSKYKGQDAVVPVFEGRPQAMPGIYSAGIKELMFQKISRNEKGMRDLLNDISVYYIDEKDVAEADSEGRSFININTVEDYRNVINQKCRQYN